MKKLSIENVDVKGQRVLMRVDFNVPIQDGKITDDNRIRAAIPTIEMIMNKGAHVLVLMSHCGRPDGRKVEKYTLRPAAVHLSSLLGKNVCFLNDCVGDQIHESVTAAPPGTIILLENLRFHLEEEGKGLDAEGKKVSASAEQIKAFRSQLTKLGTVYVNDAFGTAHRAHSSVVGIDLPIKAAGLLMEKELRYFGQALGDPARPFLSILGGAKVKDKIQLITNMLDKVNMMIIGGGMAYTFLKVMNGMKIGDSLYDEDGAAIVPDIVKKAQEKNVRLVFPIDFVCSSKFGEDGTIEMRTMEEGIPDGFMGLDCGPKSIEEFRKVVSQAKTIVWNGPVGVFEMPKFAVGSLGLLDAVLEATKAGAVSIVGGGDTGSLVTNAGKADGISHVSTGGGASLELLEGKVLPGVDDLTPA